MSIESNDKLSDEAVEQIRQAAFETIFKQARFNMRDGLNEYDEDYTTFNDLGDWIPTEMQRAMARLEAQTNDQDTALATTETALPHSQQS